MRGLERAKAVAGHQDAVDLLDLLSRIKPVGAGNADEKGSQREAGIRLGQAVGGGGQKLAEEISGVLAPSLKVL